MDVSKNRGKTPKMDGLSGQITTTSADVTLNGGLILELPQNPLHFRFRNYTNLPRMVKIMENPIKKLMIWGYHYFWKHPNGAGHDEFLEFLG